MSDGTTDNGKADFDTSSLPSSEAETEIKQESQETHSDVDTEQVNVLPGTGGPDDGGDVEVDPADIHIPGRDT